MPSSLTEPEVPENAEGGPLRPRARLLRAFGEELISSEKVAVTELVKNAYDADASHVLVRFVPPIERGGGAIEVVDDGHGMTLETIKNTWMEPGTTFRKQRTHSEVRGRRVLGEKGIGRFAASRLADRLEVVTKRADDSQEVHVLFDWTQFDDSRYLEDVVARWWTAEPNEFAPEGAVGRLTKSAKRSSVPDHGTVLRMWPLHNDWNEEAIKDLRLTLARLLRPLPAPSPPKGKAPAGDFSIFLDLPDELSSMAGAVEPSDALGNPEYSIGGSVAGDGQFDLWLRIGKRRPSRLTGKFPLDGEREPLSGPFDIELRVWDRDRTSLDRVAKALDSTIKNVRQDLDDAAGVSVYRDGFRVLPYGEQGDDWLKLDSRRVNHPTKRLSNNQIVGVVTISGDGNPALRDQTNREGLMAGDAFADLRTMVLHVLAKLEDKRYDLRHAPEAAPKRGGVFVGFDLADLEGLVRTRHPADSELLAEVEDKQRELVRRIDEAQEVLGRYRRLATLGELIDSVVHDGRTPLGKIRNAVELAIAEVVRAYVDAERLRKHLDLTDRQAAVLADLFRRIEPFGGRRRRRPGPLIIEEAIKDAFELLGSELSTASVRTVLPESTTSMTANTGEIQEILVNLIQNAVYWLKQVPRTDRQISVDVLPHDGTVEVLFSDSGPGVDPEFADRVFEPYFSTKPDGVGLGLAIAGEVAEEYYDGRLELMSSGPLPGATFRLTLRR
jgi:signal transduction histidine kinase